jgi:uncharacterized phage protein (TIGR01671 family)
MREHKFRGKTLDGDGYFEYGDLTHKRNKAYIHFCDCNNFDCEYEVDPKTVGEYTGLHDESGREIYEGDIIIRTCDLVGATHDGFTGIVKFDCASFLLESFNKKDGINLWDDVQELEIIGNKFDNPDLLQVPT